MSARRWTTRSMLLATVLPVLVGVGGTAIAYDGRLDLASQDLEKARLLLVAADDLPAGGQKGEAILEGLGQGDRGDRRGRGARSQDAAAIADAP